MTLRVHWPNVSAASRVDEMVGFRFAVDVAHQPRLQRPIHLRQPRVLAQVLGPRSDDERLQVASRGLPVAVHATRWATACVERQSSTHMCSDGGRTDAAAH